MPADAPAMPAGATARIVVIGAGHAAGRLVERLRAFGHRGEVLLIGAEPHLPYERPYLSKTLLTADEEPATPHLLPAGAVDGANTRHLARCRVTAVDPENRSVRTDAGEDLAYDILVFATGLAPRRLPLLDDAGLAPTPLQTLDEARALREALADGRPLALVGAGFIGLEVAASARALGLDVHLIDVAEYPLGRAVPQAIGAAFADLHRAAGCRIHLARRIVRVEAGAMAKLHLDTGVVIEAGHVVLGMGGVPRDDLARAAGLQVDDGILVDATGRSSDAAIYAIGDVARLTRPDGSTRRLESWRNAEDTAAATAAAITGQTPLPVQPAPWFWTDQYDRQFQILGQPCADAVQYHTGTPLEPGYAAFFVTDGQLRQVMAVDAPKAIRAARGIFRKGGAVTPDQLEGLALQPAQRVAPAGEFDR